MMIPTSDLNLVVLMAKDILMTNCFLRLNEIN